MRAGTTAIKVLPLSLAKGELGHHYRSVGWRGTMANRKRDAGREALRKKAGGAVTVGWCYVAFVSSRAGDVFERSMVWCVDLARQHSSSLLFDTVPLTDPLMTLQVLPVVICLPRWR